MGFVLGLALGLAIVPLWQRRAVIWAYINQLSTGEPSK